MSGDVRMRGFGARSRVKDAEALIVQRVAPLGIERVPFRLALGRVLGEDVVAPRNVPPHPRSAMDGYAVRAADTPGRLEVVGEITAGKRFDGVVGPGQAVRIMTGAQIPPGTDAVVMVEDTRAEPPKVVLEKTAAPAQHVLDTGSDLRAGSVVLARGRRLRPQDIAMLVSVSALEVRVAKRPRVRIVPTGSELVRAGQEPVGSEVVESNSFMLEALALRDGAEPTIHPIVPDVTAMLRQAITEPGADIVVVTGGSSVGTEDYAPLVVRELGELALHGFDVRPASPSGIGFVGSTVVVLAPGYPVASYVAWDLFVRPVVQRMLGLTPALPYATERARLGAPHKKPASRVEVQRVVLAQSPDAMPVATALPGGAALLSTITRADGFVLFPEGQDLFPAGTEVLVHLYA